MESIDGALWVSIPTPLSNDALRKVIYSSQAAFERAWRALREDGIYVADGDWARVLLSALEPVHRWFGHQEEHQATAKEGGWSKFLQSPRNADHGRPAVGYDKDSIQIKPLYIPARAPGLLFFSPTTLPRNPSNRAGLLEVSSTKTIEVHPNDVGKNPPYKEGREERESAFLRLLF